MPDKTYDILIEIRASQAQVLQQLEQGMARARKEAEGFNSAFKIGGAVAITNLIVTELSRIPSVISEAVQSGIQFNATLETAKLGIAAVLKSSDPDRFRDLNEAMAESATVVELLKQRARETSATFEELLTGFQANVGPIAQAGIRNTEEQVALLTAMSQALGAQNIPAFQLPQEVRGVLEGDTSRISRLNQVLQVTKEEMDQATAKGTAYSLLMERLAPFVEAAAQGQQSYNVLISNTRDILQQLTGVATENLFESLKNGLKEFTDELNSDQAREKAAGFGAWLGDVTKRAREAVDEFIEQRQRNQAFIEKLSSASADFFGLPKSESEGPSASDLAAAREFAKTAEERRQSVIATIQAAASEDAILSALKALEEQRAKIASRLKDDNAVIRHDAEIEAQELAIVSRHFNDIAGSAERTASAMKLTVEQIDAAIKSSAALAKANQDFDNEIAITRAKLTPDNQRDDFEAEMAKATQALFSQRIALGESEDRAVEKVREYYNVHKQAFEVAEQTRRAREGEAAATKASTDARRQEAEISRNLRSRITDVTSDPFLTVSEKSAKLIPLLLEEAEGHRLAGDAALEHAKSNEALALTFTGGIQAGLTQWVNSFGTVAQQVANTITGVLSTAISGAASAITGLLFQTKNFGQAAYQVFQSVVQQIIQMGIQMVVTAALGSILRKRSTQEQSQANAQVLSTALPAATAQTGATSGSNWIIGAIAAGVAIAAIIALIAGGFEQGGYTGNVGTRTIAGVVHGREYVQPQPAVDYYGLQVMEAMRTRSIPRERIQEMMSNFRVSVTPRFGSFEEGGAVAALIGGSNVSFQPNSSSNPQQPPAEPKVEILHFMDPDKLARRALTSDATILAIIDGLNGKMHLVRKRA